MKKIKLIIVVIGCVLMVSCGSYNPPTRGALYPKMYEEKPITLLVMPPINNTTHVDAKDLLYTSISKPLAEAGYYVISPHLAMEIFKNESAYDAELFIEQNVAMFGKVFGADAVVFSVIDTWQKQGFGITTKITYKVKSTHTNEVIFQRTCNLYMNLQQETNIGGLAGLIADITLSAIATASTQHIEAARECNAYIFKDIPRGKYSPVYLNDRETASEAPNVSKTIKR